MASAIVSSTSIGLVVRCSVSCECGRAPVRARRPPGEHLRPADVDADHDLSVHSVSLTNASGAYPDYCVRCRSEGGRSTIGPPPYEDTRQVGFPAITMVLTTISAL